MKNMKFLRLTAALMAGMMLFAGCASQAPAGASTEQAQPEAKTEAQPEAQPEAKAEAQPEAQPEAKAETQPEAKADEASDPSTWTTPAIIASQDTIGGSIISKAENYFAETMGSGASIKKFDAGRDINNALMSGSADFGNFGIVPTAVGLTNGNDFKVIWIECLIKASEAMVVREGSGIESVSDLAGKKVAVTMASSGHYGLLCALEDAGLSENDVELVDMDPNATFAAWERGDIDVAYTWNPALTRILNSGGKLLITAGDLAKNGHQTINFHVVRTAYAQEHPEMVRGYVAALAKGAALYHDDEETALNIMAPYLDMGVEDVKSLMVDDYVLLENQEAAFGEDAVANNIYSVAQFLKDAGQISDAKDVEFFKNAIDTSYIHDVVNGL